MTHTCTAKILISTLPFLVLASAYLIALGYAQSNGKSLGKTGIFIRMVGVTTLVRNLQMRCGEKKNKLC